MFTVVSSDEAAPGVTGEVIGIEVCLLLSAVTRLRQCDR